MIKPRVCILRTDGTNCDVELFYAFEKFGAQPEYVHVNQLRNKNKKLKDFNILALPGGFSYGDDIASGKILAVELTSFFSEELKKFTSRLDTLTIGICNGFQTLIRTGLLPFGFAQGKPLEIKATLTNNDSGHFECRWVKLKQEKSKCAFLQKPHEIGWYSVNHGEGKFYANNKTMKIIEQSGLVVFRYVDESGNPTQKYPENPNGSINAIAGICDPTGRIFGMMPHPEKFVDITQYPNWRRLKYKKPARHASQPRLPKTGHVGQVAGVAGRPHGAFLFEEMIQFVKKA